MGWREIRRLLFPKRMIDADVHDEISFHVEERVRELVAEGWREDDARAHVLERFGDVESVRELCREYDAQRAERSAWRLRMTAWTRDVRLAVRSLKMNPGFTAVVVVTLALGVGATTAVFSVVESILLRPLPFPAADRLAIVWQNDRATGTLRENSSTSDYFDYVQRSRSFEDLAMTGTGPAVLARSGADPLQLERALVTANLVDVLGIGMQLGRSFTDEEDQPDGASVVILTDRIWRDVFGADPDVVGRVLTIDELPYEVVGVLPPGIEYPEASTDVWMPMGQSPTTADRARHWVRVVGRLSEGTSLEAADAEMARIMADLEAEYPSDNTNRGAFVERLSDVGRGDLKLTLWVLFGAVLVVLAIACVNVANLLLARGASRSREIAVLTAVGAGPAQISRRFFVEGVLITLIAGAAGIGVAAIGVPLLTGLAPPELDSLGDPRVGGPVLAFGLGVSLLICVGFGLLPSLQARRMDVQGELKEARTTEGAAAGLTLRGLLVAGQLALAVVLLVAATLLIGTLRSVSSVDPGFTAANTLRADFALPASRFPSFETWPEWPSILGFLRSLEEEVEAIPGVHAAAVALNHPLDAGFTNSFRIEGQPYDPTQGEMSTRLVTPGYFETVGLEVLAGRGLEEGDRLETPGVVLLNRAAADRYFPDGGAIGSRVTFWGQTREVVGIAEDERIHGLTADAPPTMYVTMYQSPPRGGKMTLMIRSEVPPLTLVDGIREAMRGVDPDVPVFNVSTMEATLAEAMSRERFASTILTIFAVIAVFLAILGVHGVLSYLVTQRGHEVGVRMALGATRRDVVRLIVRQGAAMTVLGVVVGLVTALAVSGVLEGLLYGLSHTTPRVYWGVGLGLALVALAATALPAHRAASIDPVASLRGE